MKWKQNGNLLMADTQVEALFNGVFISRHKISALIRRDAADQNKWLLMLSSESAIEPKLCQKTKSKFQPISGGLGQYTASHDTLDDAAADAEALLQEIKQQLDPDVAKARTRNDRDAAEMREWLSRKETP